MRSRFGPIFAVALSLVASAAPPPALAIDGDLDPTFSGDGKMTVHFPSSDSHDLAHLLDDAKSRARAAAATQPTSP